MFYTIRTIAVGFAELNAQRKSHMHKVGLVVM